MIDTKYFKGNDSTTIKRFVNKYDKYHHEAYDFIYGALQYSSNLNGKSTFVTLENIKIPDYSATTKELVEGVAGLALEKFGGLGKFVLEHWGIRKSEDIGEVTYNLIDMELFWEDIEDKKEDFQRYDLESMLNIAQAPLKLKFKKSNEKFKPSHN
jgi:uncharacterized repeat protein (TIGR04138 family)